VCPECKRIRSLKTPISPIKDAVKNGITAIEIKEGLICPHNFIAEIGRDFMQRSSYTIDFTIPKENSTLNKTIKLSTLIPRLNLSKIIIKKANKIITTIANLIFIINIRARRNLDL
jgi:hypothetical protein